MLSILLNQYAKINANVNCEILSSLKWSSLLIQKGGFMRGDYYCRDITLISMSVMKYIVKWYNGFE